MGCANSTQYLLIDFAILTCDWIFFETLEDFFEFILIYETYWRELGRSVWRSSLRLLLFLLCLYGLSLGSLKRFFFSSRYSHSLIPSSRAKPRKRWRQLIRCYSSLFLKRCIFCVAIFSLFFIAVFRVKWCTTFWLGLFIFSLTTFKSFFVSLTERRKFDIFTRWSIWVSHSVVKTCSSMTIHLHDGLRWIIFHVNNLYASHSIEWGQPEKLFFFRSTEQKEFTIFSLQGKRVFPFAGYSIWGLISVILHRIYE